MSKKIIGSIVNIIGIVASIVTIITFVSVLNFEKMRELFNVYYGFILLLFVPIGVANYLVVFMFMKLQRTLISIGCRLAGCKPIASEHKGHKYCAMLLFIGLCLLEFWIIKPLIQKSMAMQYIGMLIAFVFNGIFVYSYLFKKYNWGMCVGYCNKSVVLLFSLWSIIVVVLVIQCFFF